MIPNPEQEALNNQLGEQEEGQNQEPASQEGPAEGEEGQPEGPTATEGQPSTETQPKPDPLARFKTDFALAKSYAEIKTKLGEANDLENYSSREELGKAYLEAERRLGGRGKAPTTTEPQPASDERYNSLQQQLAQTQNIINQIVPSWFSGRKPRRRPRNHKFPKRTRSSSKAWRKFIRVFRSTWNG